MPAPIIMVHGAFCAGWVFEAFKAPFEAAGHPCLTADLPGHGPGENAAGISISDYAKAVVAQIEALDRPPILIGHSLGGLVAQLAAAKAKVAAMALLSPSPPWGVSGGSMEEAAQVMGLMSLGPYWTGAVPPDFSVFVTASADRLSAAEQKATFARLTPESGRALFETIQWWLDPFLTTSVMPALGGPPILVLSGGRDQIHSPALARQVAERCGADFRVFMEMSHWLIGEPGYEEVADAVLRWLPTRTKAAA
jgi:pimeloyl-ACP methyl ester carboxylesterase